MQVQVILYKFQVASYQAHKIIQNKLQTFNIMFDGAASRRGGIFFLFVKEFKFNINQKALWANIDKVTLKFLH